MIVPKDFVTNFGSMARVMQLPPPKDVDYTTYYAYFSRVGLVLKDMIAMCETAPARLRIYNRLPTVAELLECRPGETNDQRAARAWDAVMLQIETSGTHKGVDFDDLKINAAVRSIGGWSELGRTDPGQLDWRRREFLAAYKGCMVSEPDPGLCAPLSGSAGTGKHVFAATGLSDRHPALERSTPEAVLGLTRGIGGKP